MAKAAVEGLAFSDEKKKYIVETLDPLLEQMVQSLLAEAPSDPVGFMMGWLQKRQSGRNAPSGKLCLAEANAALKKELTSMRGFVADAAVAVGGNQAAAPAESKSKADDSDEESEEEEDDADDEPVAMPPPVNRGPRQSVSAEAYGTWNKVRAFQPPEHPKTEEQATRIREILIGTFLFSTLERKEQDIIVKAMVEKNFASGAKIITEGEDGNHLYVIEQGSPECKKKIDGEQKVVKKCGPGDVFGELALLYNAPRAASVEATDECKCWELDRETFSHIVKEAASKSREQHDGFLQKVSLFAKMEAYERSQICDTLKVDRFQKGDLVVKQDEEGDKFFIVEEGALQAEKGAEAKVVMEYGSGEYFGELALLKNQPRAASVRVTSGEAKLLSLDRKSFRKMLGPIEEILKRKEADYK